MALVLQIIIMPKVNNLMANLVNHTEVIQNTESYHLTWFGFEGMNQAPFFESVDIYVLHQGNFSQYSISNPLITQWDHDTLDQANGQKLLQNKMSLSYDSVVYSQGIIQANETVANAF